MKKTLRNKLFISTRPKGRSVELKRLFEARGAELLDLPMIEVQAAEVSDQEKKWMANLENFQWLIFTSPNGVNFFFQQYNKITNRKELPEKLQIAVVGSKTEKAVNNFSYPVDFVNPGNTGDDFAEAFSGKLKNNGNLPNVLLALGNMARNVIQENLKDTANCFRLNIYETTEPDTVDEKIVQNVNDNRYEMIIFTSPSGVHNFLKFVGNSNPEKLRIACIGEITARAAREKGIEPLVVAENPSAEGIVNSIINFYH